MQQFFVGKLPVTSTDYTSAVAYVCDAVGEDRARTPGYVCCANVHMCMVAKDESDFAEVVAGAALVTPDGMPLVWALRWLHQQRLSDRVYGPTYADKLCAEMAARGLRLGLYGGTESSIQSLHDGLKARYPDLQINYAWAPPFRPLTDEEDDQVVADIQAAGVDVLLVGLGCPKQERWMAAHQHRLDCWQIGVGAFFDFYSGRVKQAPAWMQSRGLEWLFRLCMEPKRLWRRYLYNNPRFIFLLLSQKCKRR